MILLEGPDRCGKTTVAEMLRGLLPGWSYRHHTKPPVDAYTYFAWFLADTHPRVIVDRMHWSAQVYDKVFERSAALTPHQWRLIELAHMSRGTTVYCLNDDPQQIFNRWGDDEMYLSDKIPQLCTGFNQLCSGDGDPPSYLPHIELKLPDLIFNGKPCDYARLLAMSDEDNARFATRNLPASLGIGKTPAEFMILGEAPGSPIKGSMRPSLPWDEGPAAEHLWAAFDVLELAWWQGYYTNASAFGSIPEFAHYINSVVRPKRILAFGARARTLCTMAQLHPNTEVFNVLHPSVARRFHSHLHDEWVDVIGRALAPWSNGGK